MSIEQLVLDAELLFDTHLNALHSALRKTGCQHKNVTFILDEAKCAFSALKKIIDLHLPEAQLAKAIREFLKTQREGIIGSEADYFSLPFSPINQLCVKLAQAIAQPNEPLISILIPTLINRHYDILQQSLMELTEDSRELNLNDLILSEDKTTLISISACFDGARRSGKDDFNHLYMDGKNTLALNDSEKNCLRLSVMPFSDEFFEALEAKKQLKNNKDTLTALVSDFCQNCSAFGAGNPGASVAQAAEGSYELIKNFMTIWNSLPTDLRETLENLSFSAECLGFYLRYLESRISPDKHKKELRLFNEMQDSQDGCIRLVSHRIQHILDRNIEQFNAVKLDTLAVSPLTNDKPTLYIRLEALMESLNNALTARENKLAKAFLYSVPHMVATCRFIVSHQKTPYAIVQDQYYRRAAMLNGVDFSIYDYSDLMLATKYIDPTFLAEHLKDHFLLEEFYTTAIQKNNTDITRVIIATSPSFALRYIIDAVIGNDVDELNIARGINFHQTDAEMKTLLHHACIAFDCKKFSTHNQRKIINFLLENGVKSNEKNIFGLTPLHYFPEALPIIVEHEPTLLCSANRFLLALKSDNTEIAKKIILSGKLDLNIISKEGKSLLYYAIDYRCREVVELLIEKNVKVSLNETGTLFRYKCVCLKMCSCDSLADIVLNEISLDDLNQIDQNGKRLLDRLDSDHTFFFCLIKHGARFAPKAIAPLQNRGSRSHGRSITPLAQTEPSPCYEALLHLVYTREDSKSVVMRRLIRQLTLDELLSFPLLNKVLYVYDIEGGTAFECLFSQLKRFDTFSHLKIYAHIIAGQLEQTRLSHPCYSLRIRKAERIHSAVHENNAVNIIHALEICESRFRFWRSPEAVTRRPQFLTNYCVNELNQASQMKQAF